MLYRTITDPMRHADLLRRRPYGVIHTAGGRLISIRLRPFPKIASIAEAQIVGQWMHNAVRTWSDAWRRAPREPGCWLYYNQPMSCPNYLALAYGISQRGCSLASVQMAARVLDEIARLKQSDAMLCDVAGSAISERALLRFGWEPHAPSRWHRNYIKRFYGEYLEPLDGWPASVCSAIRLAGDVWPGALVNSGADGSSDASQPHPDSDAATKRETSIPKR